MHINLLLLVYTIIYRSIYLVICLHFIAKMSLHSAHYRYKNLKGCLWKPRTHHRQKMGVSVLLRLLISSNEKKVREKSRECHNHKPQPFPDPKRKRKPTNLNKHKPNKRTKSTKISSLFTKRGNRNTKRTEKHKNKMTHGKTYNKSPRRINHKATGSKTNTGTRKFATLLKPSNVYISCTPFSKIQQ